MSARRLIYLDNASTSYPKPKSVTRAVERAVGSFGVNPGRGGYSLTRRADRLIFEARKSFASFFNLADSSRIVFTPGGTYSLNMAIRGLLKKGDRVITTGRPHNAVVRPLYDRSAGLDITTLGGGSVSAIRENDIASLITRRTRAVVVNHASNVDGLLYPLGKIGRITRKLGLALIVDAAQTAGLVEIDMKKANIDLLCVTGHKSLMGPMGIGLLAASPTIDLKPLISGGTGSFSDDEQMPENYPDRLEPGTLNLPGIAGLAAGLKEVSRIGVRKIFAHKMKLCNKAYDALTAMEGVTVYWPQKDSERIPLFSFNIDAWDPAEVGDILDRRYSIACRVGLHCAPRAHMEAGTYPIGSIRFAPGFYTKVSEVGAFISAVREIAGKIKR
ncbi:MAG: aminotransferase class V-fold PLP-dependent enzyme [Nitrospinota bacterium]